MRQSEPVARRATNGRPYSYASVNATKRLSLWESSRAAGERVHTSADAPRAARVTATRKTFPLGEGGRRVSGGG